MVQRDAFKAIVATRPLGLLQGPPGTGKTRFIAALAHYALERGLASNVLLASQSHEAVNSAAEALLQLYRRGGTAPSLLRVGNEAVVSERLMPFHPERVEQAFKDRFRADLRQRMALCANALGLTPSLAEKLHLLETIVRPMFERIERLVQDEPEATPPAALQADAAAAMERLEIEPVAFDTVFNTEQALSAIAERLRVRESGDGVSPDRVARYRQIAALGRDFVSSAPGPQRSLEPFLAGTRQIVAGTCVGLGRTSLGLTSTAFDLVIVDEAARCTASELAVPMQAGRWVVLVGDQAQLEPQHPRTVVNDVARALGVAKRDVARSDFDRVFASVYGEQAGKTLTTQYRMLPPIGRIVSAAFYDRLLTHGRTAPNAAPDVWPNELRRAAIWLSTDDLGVQARQQRDQSGASLPKPSEVELIVALLQRWQLHERFMQWLGEARSAEAIGVICTYASQRDLLRRRLHGAGLAHALLNAIKIDTVDAYQGKENPVVILSLVRNNWDGPIEDGTATIAEGFMSRPNRINVAVSRAMDRLVLVGAYARWSKAGPMARVRSAFDEEVACEEALLLRPSALQARDGAKSKGGRGVKP